MCLVAFLTMTQSSALHKQAKYCLLKLTQCMLISGQRPSVNTFSQRRGISHTTRCLAFSLKACNFAPKCIIINIMLQLQQSNMQLLNQVFTCTLTLGREGEAQFIGRKVGPSLTANSFVVPNFQNSCC